MDKIRIGIQFNFDPPHEKVSIKQTPLFAALDMKSDGWHIDTLFTRKELKRFDPKKVESEKINLMKRLLKRYASYSSYTNIYTFIEAGRLSKVKNELLENDFEKDRIRIDLTNRKDLISNFSSRISNPSFIKFINRNLVVKLINSLYAEVANRDYALEQKITVTIAYESKEEYDHDTDLIEIGIQLEMINNTNTTSVPATPTYDFFEKYNDSEYALEEIIENFIFSLENNYFQMWDAVVAKEENKPLTDSQKKWLDQLINFGDPSDEEILYIDGMHRPKHPWHITANVIAKKLVTKLKSYESYFEVSTKGWTRMKEAIMQHDSQLPKPDGIEQAIHVVPESLRHQLEIQAAMDWLVGLGQEPELTLADKEQHFRIEELIGKFSKKLDSLRYFELSIHKICTDFIELPQKDELIFKQEMINRLRLADKNEPIIEKLIQFSK